MSVPVYGSDAERSRVIALRQAGHAKDEAEALALVRSGGRRRTLSRHDFKENDPLGAQALQFQSAGVGRTFHEAFVKVVARRAAKAAALGDR